MSDTDIIINDFSINKEHLIRIIKYYTNELNEKYFNNSLNISNIIKYIYIYINYLYELNKYINTHKTIFKSNEFNFKNSLEFIIILLKNLKIFCIICIFMYLIKNKIINSSTIIKYFKNNSLLIDNFTIKYNDINLILYYDKIFILYKYDTNNVFIYNNETHPIKIFLILFDDLTKIELCDNNNNNFCIYNCLLNDNDIHKLYFSDRLLNTYNINNERQSRIKERNLKKYDRENSRSRSPIRNELSLKNNLNQLIPTKNSLNHHSIEIINDIHIILY